MWFAFSDMTRFTVERVYGLMFTFDRSQLIIMLASPTCLYMVAEPCLKDIGNILYRETFTSFYQS